MLQKQSTGPIANRVPVIVADNSRMGSQLLSDALQRDPRFEVVDPCSNSGELLSRAASHSKSVIVLSVNLDDEPLRGFDVARQLRTRYPETRVVMVLDNSKRDLVVGAFGAGAQGVFCRSDSIESLRKCIQSIHQGQVWATSKEMRYVLEAFVDTAPQRLLDAKGTALLSKREQEVVRCVTEGLTNREIAARLNLSEHTIKNYMFRIFDKLGVSTRVEMVLYAFSQRSPSQAAGDAQDFSLSGDQGGSALESTRRDAERGLVSAQLLLGEIYSEGRGVPKDKLAAYTWFLIAETLAADATKKSKAALDRLAPKMNTDASAESRHRANEWLKLHANLPLHRSGANGEMKHPPTAISGSSPSAKKSRPKGLTEVSPVPSGTDPRAD